MNAKSPKPWILACGLAAGLVVGNAFACGEVMYRMGGALRYQAWVTHHPAQILIYSDHAEDSAANAGTKDFNGHLEKAGHHVTIVNNAQALAQALAAHSYDVIISRADDLATVNSQVAHAERSPSLIPMYKEGGDSIRKQYPLAQSDDASLGQILKVIEKAMKERGA